METKTLLLLTVWLYIFSCSSPEKPIDNDSLGMFVKVPGGHSGLNFKNSVPEDSANNILTYLNYYNGGGVAISDFDNDGLEDVFLSANISGSKLYRNLGDLQFEDITSSSCITYDSNSWVTGVSIVDINSDGLMDIYLSRSGRIPGIIRENLLFVNQSDGCFKEMGAEYGVNDAGCSTQGVFFDFDRDGDLDLYVLNHPPNFDKINKVMAYQDETYGPEGIDHLYENRNGVFVDITEAAGLSMDPRFGLSISISDVNHDGFPDIYIGNDFWPEDFFYLNNEGKGFIMMNKRYFDKHSISSMGSDFGDINNDGYQDLIVLDMLPQSQELRNSNFMVPPLSKFKALNSYGFNYSISRNTLHLSNYGNDFSEVGEFAGVSATDWSWSPLFADFDNDGWDDLFVTNGLKRDLTNIDYSMDKLAGTQISNLYLLDNKMSLVKGMPSRVVENLFYKNYEGQKFQVANEIWGVESLVNSNGAAYGDLDNDGDLDLVVNNMDSLVCLYENHSADSGNYIKISLRWDDGNYFAIGAKVYLYYNEVFQYKELSPVHGFQSSSSLKLHFGVGDVQIIDSIVVVWPGNYKSVVTNPSINYHHTFYSDSMILLAVKNTSQKQNIPIFSQFDYGSEFIHTELPATDYNIQRIIPKSISWEGPGLCVHDFNGDGLDDFYIGGANGQSGAIYLQDNAGKFTSNAVLPPDISRTMEDQSCISADFDGDGSTDLLLANGSHEFFYEGSSHDFLIPNLTASLSGDLELIDFPGDNYNSSVAISSDYDLDGDLDLFIGTRSVPGKYPLSKMSRLLQNDNGKFIDVTRDYIPDMKPMLVTSALWSDFNSDGYMDLWVLGEYQPIRLFMNNGGEGFVEVTSDIGLGATNGYWNSINGGDFDYDGDIDYVLGNVGENVLFNASTESPIVLFSGDFDNNGVIDPLLTYSIDGKRAPMVGRDLLCEQMPVFNNNFNTYTEYAQSEIQDIIPESMYDTCRKDTVVLLSSVLIENVNGERFEIHKLPFKAQLFPVYGTLIADFNGDNALDVLLGGNSFSHFYMWGNLDAGRGLLLEGNGDLTFNVNDKSGFYLRKATRSLSFLFDDYTKQFVIMAASNNDTLKAFTCVNDFINDTNLRFKDNETSCIVYFKNGKTQRIESYLGNGYLSQATSMIPVFGEVDSITYYTNMTRARSLVLKTTNP